MGATCWKHEYDGPSEICPECYAEGPQEFNEFDYDKGRFSSNERVLINKINEFVGYIRELRGLST